jgi:hypothetical protein
MESRLKEYAADHRDLLEAAARHAGFRRPVAVFLSEFYAPLVKAARKVDLLPVDGALVRSWDDRGSRLQPGLMFGLRVYEIDGIRFVRVRCSYDQQQHHSGLDFFAVDRRDYRRLYRVALRLRRDAEPPAVPPVLPEEQADRLWKNTIGYLEPANLRRIKEFGGRPRRGVLLTGAPGNGKTMACRWIWEECRRRRWEWTLVSPDAYRQARNSSDPVESVKELFSVERRGIIFFDDMDIALRDRETVRETEDQAVFLSALDGIEVHEGVVFVFTTNCSLALIDRAFQRPGRIDVVLQFKGPDAELRRQLIDRWHEDVRGHLDVEAAVASTDGYSFAEVEELKNLLVMHYLDGGAWDWGWALQQFDVNRSEFAARRRHAGFGAGGSGNGD